MARAGAREEDQHPRDCNAGQHDHDCRRAREQPERDAGVLHVVDPEGPDDVLPFVEGEAARHEMLGELIRSDCCERDRTEREPVRQHLRRATARRPRPARARPSRIRRVRRTRAWPARSPALGLARRRRCRAPPTDTRRGAPRRSPRRRRYTFRRCLRSIRSSAPSISLEHLLGVLAERVVDLAVERRRRGVAEMIVACSGDLLRLVIDRARVLFAQVVDRVLHALALLQQLVRNRSVSMLMLVGPFCSIVRGDARRRSMSAGPTPVSSTILSRPP